MKTLLLRFMFSLICPLIFTSIACAGKVNVVVSIYPLKDIVKQVGGDMVDVDFIVPPGASPHTFEPTPSDMLKMHRARMFVIIGAGLEFWADRAVRAAGRRDLKVIVLSEGMPLIHGGHSHGEGRGINGTGADPHIWLDPLLTGDMADRIASALIELDGANGSYYRKRAEAFKRQLYELHRRIMKAVSRFRTREYVTFHPAWNYFSRRYGLKVIGVIEELPGKEASPRHIAGLINEIRKTGAKVVFAEPQFNPKMAELIAKEAGARVLILDPLGGPDLKGRDTYIGLMLYNLSILEQAMR